MSGVPRRALASDAAACAAIVDRWIEDTPWMVRDLSRVELQKVLADGLPKREAYVVGDPVAGYVSFDPVDAHIWGLYVGPRGQGLGRALVDRVKEGRNYVQLNTHVPNARAHAFYGREGFVKTGAVWMGDSGIEEIRMEWRR